MEASGATTTLSYNHTDHLGSTNATTDKYGYTTEVIAYRPFGDTRVDQQYGGIDSTKTYIGETADYETQMSYLNARYLKNKRGQFMSQDPVHIGLGVDSRTAQALKDPQLMNSYGYARNNPLIYKDQNGEWVHVLIGAGAGIVGQYGYDVYNNIQADGFNASDFTSLSSPKTYAVRAGQGAFIAATGGAAAVTSNVIVQAAITGVASGVGGAGANYVLGEQVTMQSLALDTAAGAATFGLMKGAPQVRGRNPNFGTASFYTGKHTQQSAMKLGIEANVNMLTAQLGDIYTQLKFLQQQASDKQSSSKINSKDKK